MMFLLQTTWGVRRRRRWRHAWWLGVILAWFLSGCASGGPQPIIEDNLVAFTASMDAMLKTGMTLKEARAVLKERMPPASISTDGPIAGGSRSLKMRRLMVGWPTLNPGSTLVVTLFSDAEGRLVRWTTGHLLN